jgi:hypothetical protein
MLQALRSTIVLTAVAFSRPMPTKAALAFAAAFKNVKGTLEGGLKAAERVGSPVSARFVLEDGILQLSLTDPDKIKAATAQKLAIDSATISMFAATESTVKAGRSVFCQC